MSVFLVILAVICALVGALLGTIPLALAGVVFAILARMEQAAGHHDEMRRIMLGRIDDADRQMDEYRRSEAAL